MLYTTDAVVYSETIKSHIARKATKMRTLIIAAAIALGSISFAHADIVDDNLAKAEKSFASAQKRLEKAKECAANRETCIADMRAKAEKRLASAQKAIAKLGE